MELLRTFLQIELFLVGAIAGYNFALLREGLRSFDDEFEEEVQPAIREMERREKENEQT